MMERSTAGWGSGLLGVVIFSGSLPATRIAVGGFTPLFLTSARAVIAALLGIALLATLRQKRPDAGDLGPLAIVALGVVVGFPLLTAQALLTISEGATLSRRLGGWQVISWALLLSLPIMAAVALATLPARWSGIGLPVWAGLGYVAVFSMLIGFVFWYRGLALGGIAAVGQLQLLQPFFGLLLAGLLLHEQVAPTMIAATGLVVLCVAGAKRFA
jgi:drug/metabolite transporter (DMT)-like permease